MLNSQQYLESRWKYPFGSATDPEGGGYQLFEDEYVEQPLTLIDSSETYAIDDTRTRLDSINPNKSSVRGMPDNCSRCWMGSTSWPLQ